MIKKGGRTYEAILGFLFGRDKERPQIYRGVLLYPAIQLMSHKFSTPDLDLDGLDLNFTSEGHKSLPYAQQCLGTDYNHGNEAASSGMYFDVIDEALYHFEEAVVSCKPERFFPPNVELPDQQCHLITAHYGDLQKAALTLLATNNCMLDPHHFIVRKLPAEQEYRQNVEAVTYIHTDAIRIFVSDLNDENFNDIKIAMEYAETASEFCTQTRDEIEKRYGSVVWLFSLLKYRKKTLKTTHGAVEILKMCYDIESATSCLRRTVIQHIECLKGEVTIKLRVQKLGKLNNGSRTFT